VKGPPRNGLGTTVFAFGIIVVLIVATISFLAISATPGTNSGVNSTTSPSGTNSTNPNSLAVYEEICSMAYGPPPVNYYQGSNCEAPNQPVRMPTTYDLVTVSQSQSGASSTLDEVYFAVFLASGQLANVTISSSMPLDVYVFFYNHTSIDTSALSNETVHGAHPIESSGGVKTASYCLPDGQLRGQNEWYIFQILGGSLGQAATATFNIQSNSSCSTPPPQG
jgi:hypothetical protein